MQQQHSATKITLMLPATAPMKRKTVRLISASEPSSGLPTTFANRLTARKVPSTPASLRCWVTTVVADPRSVAFRRVAMAVAPSSCTFMVYAAVRILNAAASACRRRRSVSVTATAPTSTSAISAIAATSAVSMSIKATSLTKIEESSTFKTKLPCTRATNTRLVSVVVVLVVAVVAAVVVAVAPAVVAVAAPDVVIVVVSVAAAEKEKVLINYVKS